jgi:hypothetical protein
MEIDQRTMESIAKGYESMPLVLKAITEQMEKMNTFLNSMNVKNAKEEASALEKAKEDALVSKAVDAAVKKAEALISSEAKKLQTTTLHEEQQPIGKAIPPAVAAEAKKQEEEEAEGIAASKKGCVEPGKETGGEKKIEKEVPPAAAGKKEEYPEMEKALTKAITSEAFQKSLQDAINSSVETHLAKNGFIKAGVIVKPKNFGVSGIDVIKSSEKQDPEEARKALRKLSYAQLTELESKVQSGETTLPAYLQ